MTTESFHKPAYHLSHLAFHFSNKLQPTKKLQALRKFQRYYIGDEYPGIYFTHQEVCCITYFLADFNQQQTSEKMGISQTSVSQHCVSMKRKLGCHSKSDLIAAVKKTNFKCYSVCSND